MPPVFLTQEPKWVCGFSPLCPATTPAKLPERWPRKGTPLNVMMKRHCDIMLLPAMGAVKPQYTSAPSAAQQSYSQKDSMHSYFNSISRSTSELYFREWRFYTSANSNTHNDAWERSITINLMLRYIHRVNYPLTRINLEQEKSLRENSI